MKNFFILLCFVLLFFSCKQINSPDLPEPTPTPEIISTQGKYWTGSYTPFEERSRAGIINFENIIWVFGGRKFNGSDFIYYNDVWRSNNGVDWILLTQNAAFEARSDFATTSFNGYIWLIGGFCKIDDPQYPGSKISQYLNDVYKSSNGIDWQLVTANAKFLKRENAVVLNYKNYLWVIGGHNAENGNVFFNDVWKSSDGVDWILVTGNANFQKRAEFAGFVFKNDMWIIGGNGSMSYLRDIWKSSDGINWTPVNDCAGFSSRRLLQAFVHNDTIWVIAGYDGNYKNDIYKSKDGINWTCVISGADFLPRRGHGAISFKNKIFVLCGEDSSDYFNDIWVSE